MLPPSGEEGNFEIQVGTWWATRIGTLFLVIAIVFGGVYMAQFAKPWMRFVEITTVSFVMTFLGLWLERRYPKYGAVVFGGGLAALFFCAFGAYVVPAVKILDDPLIGAILQLATVAGIVYCALARSSSIIAMMGIFFGYVACFFSFHAGMNDLALLSALFLGCAGVYCYQVRLWGGVYAISVGLSYALYAVVLIFGWMEDQSLPYNWKCHSYLLAFLGLYAGADIAGLRRGVLLEPVSRRWIQLFNSSAAAFLGFLVTRLLFPADLSYYYFIYGIILTGLALAYYFMEHPDALMHGYFLKGSALITMGLINSLGGRTRWIALGIESVILLFSARRSRLKIAEFMMGAVWLASLGFFIHQTQQQQYVSLISVSGLLALGYVLLSALLLAGKGAGWGARPLGLPPAPIF